MSVIRRREVITLLGGAAAGRSSAGGAAGADAECRRVHGGLCCGRPGRAGSRWGVAAGAAATRLDHRPQCADRVPLGRGRCRAHSQICGGIGRAVARRHPDFWQRDHRALLQATRTVPVVFVNVSDPVGSGFVDSLVRPGGNATGFIQFEFGLAGKWLELLKQIAPGVMRAAVIRDPAISAGLGQWGALQTAAPSLGVELTPVNVRDAGEIERAVATFARQPNGGLIVTGSAAAAFHRNLIVALAARHKLPAVSTHAIPLPPAASSPMRLILSTSTGKRPATSIASSRARSPPTCRCKRRPSTSLLSISRPRRRSARLQPALLATADEVIE